MSLGSVVRGLALGVLAVAPLASGCADTYGQGNAPPHGALYFPTSVVTLPPLAAAPDHRFALVVSSNFDLRFSAGWISLVDLDALTTAQKPADAVVQQIRLPDFGGPIAIDRSGQLAEGETRLAVVGHRGASELSIIEVTVSGGVPHLSCGNRESVENLDAIERRTDCDRAHLFSMTEEGLKQQQTSSSTPESTVYLSKDNNWGFDATVDPLGLVDPYGTAMYADPLDPGTQHLALSFLSHGPSDNARVLTFKVDPASSTPAGFLIPEHAVDSQRVGLGPIAVQPRASCDPALPDSCAVRLAIGNRIYGSLEGSSIALLTIDASGARVSLHGLANEVSGNEIGQIAFASPYGERAYALNNSPDGVVALDTTPYVSYPSGGTATQELNFGITDVVPAAGRPSGVVYVQRNDEDLVALTRFTGNDVMLVAVVGAALVPVAELRDVGNGPFAIDTLRDAAGDDLLLVGTFYDHGLALLRVPQGDVSAASIVTRVRSSELGDGSKR